MTSPAPSSGASPRTWGNALIATADDLIADDLMRRAAAAGCTPTLVNHAVGAAHAWARAAVVLVGADLAEDIAALSPPRRERVHLVCWGPPGDAVFRPALRMGAESVIELPLAGDWVTEVLSDLADAAAGPGLLIGVIGGSGGAGATSLCCAMSQISASREPTLVVDADPLGPGLDRVLGMEQVAGVRWHDLAGPNSPSGSGVSGGRFGARALREALPRRDCLSVLTWSAGTSAPPDPAVVREVIAAGVRGHHTTVLDLPRAADSTDLASRCDLVILVAAASVTGIASAARTLHILGDAARVQVVVRGRADVDLVASAVGAPVLGTMTDQRGLAEAIDLGVGPLRSRRGPLARAARECLAAAEGLW
ncbi:septum site determining protein [soil metagenome]